MKVYLNNISRELNILPTQSQTLDETLDGFSFTFLSSYMTPIAPMNVVRVEEGSDTSYFVVVADSVEPFTQEGKLFRHTLSCAQNSRRLSKKQIRNSVFSQPPYEYRQGFFSFSWIEKQDTEYPDPDSYMTIIDTMSDQGVKDPLTLYDREKCYQTSIEIGLQVARYHRTSNSTAYQPKTIEEVKALFPAIETAFVYPTLTLHYKDNGNDETTSILPSDCGMANFLFNTQMVCPKIATLLKEGKTDLWIETNGIMASNPDQDPINEYALSFYNVKTVINAETYYNSCYDVLQYLIDRHVLNREIDGNPIGEEQLFYLPQSGDLYNLLKETPAPNFVFTELSLYECVAEVFRLFDAIFTLNGENILGIEFFNARGATITPKVAGMNSTLGEERYANSLLTYFQDARVKETFGFNNLRTREIGVATQTDHVFLTPHPIQSLSKCEIRGSIAIWNHYLNQDLRIDNYVLDITHFVLPKSTWATLDTSSNPPSDFLGLSQLNTIYYDENGIDVAYMRTLANNMIVYSFDYMVYYAWRVDLGVDLVAFDKDPQPYISSSNWWNFKMRAEYVSSIDGKTKVETSENKVNGEILVDQSNGAVDLSLMGANMVGLSLRTGNPSLNCVHRITSWANRIKKGQVYVYDGKTWIANSCAYSFTGDFWQGQISFVQNYNEMNLRKRVLSERRFTNISANLILKSEEILTERVYVSLEDEITAQDTHMKLSSLKEMIADRFGESATLKIGNAYLKNRTEFPSYPNVSIPLVIYGAGNAINFEMAYSSPMVAGIMTKPDSVWNTGYYSSYIKYADENGFLENCSIGIEGEQVEYDDYFPCVPTSTEAVSIDDFLVEKQPNEIFALNYQLSFLSTDLNIGRKLVEDNLFTNKEPINSKIRLFFGSEAYTPMETLGKGDEVSITDVSLTDQSGGLKLSLTFPSSSGYWAITDENKNILLSSKTTKTGIALGLYFKLRRDRI